MRVVALLRAVNVGGRKVKMDQLRAGLTEAGYDDVRTLLASGNVIFEARAKSSAALEPKLDADILAATGVAAEAIVRNGKEWRAIIDTNPFPKEAKAEPSRFVVVVCRGKPDAAAINAYLKTFDGPERVKVVGSEIYVFFPDGQAKSDLKLPKKAFVGTGRNWNTVLKIADLLDA